MFMLKYSVHLEKDDNDTWLVTFPDFEDAVTFGESQEEALVHAVDALEAAIVYRMCHKLTIPTPSATRGRKTVTITPLIAAKALLYKELQEQQLSIRELAKRMDCDYPIAHRLLDVSRRTQMNEIARALTVLGRNVVVGIE